MLANTTVSSFTGLRTFLTHAIETSLTMFAMVVVQTVIAATTARKTIGLRGGHWIVRRNRVLVAISHAMGVARH